MAEFLDWDERKPFGHIYCPFDPVNAENEREAEQKVLAALPAGAKIIRPLLHIPGAEVRLLPTGVRSIKEYGIMQNMFFGRCDIFYRTADVQG
jgi:hypothetical protein